MLKDIKILILLILSSGIVTGGLYIFKYYNNDFVVLSLFIVIFGNGILFGLLINWFYLDIYKIKILEKLENINLFKYKSIFFFFLLLLCILVIISLVNYLSLENIKTYKLLNEKIIHLITFLLGLNQLIICIHVLLMSKKNIYFEITTIYFYFGLIGGSLLGLLINFYTGDFSASAMEIISDDVSRCNKNHFEKYNYYQEITDFDLPAIVLKNLIGKTVKPGVDSKVYKGIEIFNTMNSPKPIKYVIGFGLKVNKTFWNNYQITDISKYKKSFYKK
jgi:hypothetical protein